MKLGPRQQALVDALRSGKYSQGEANLRIGDDFCCLGVACDISKLGFWTDYDEERKSYKFLAVVAPGVEHERSILVPAVKEFYGFKNEIGGFIEDGFDTSLTEQNDKGVSFDKIADLIEKHSDQIFKESL